MVSGKIKRHGENDEHWSRNKFYDNDWSPAPERRTHHRREKSRKDDHRSPATPRRQTKRVHSTKNSDNDRLARNKYDRNNSPPPARSTSSRRENNRRNDRQSVASPRRQPEKVQTRTSNDVLVISNSDSSAVFKEDSDNDRLARDKYDSDDSPPPARKTSSRRENNLRNDRQSVASPRRQPEKLQIRASNDVLVISNSDSSAVLKKDSDNDRWAHDMFDDSDNPVAKPTFNCGENNRRNDRQSEVIPNLSHQSTARQPKSHDENGNIGSNAHRCSPQNDKLEINDRKSRYRGHEARKSIIDSKNPIFSWSAEDEETVTHEIIQNDRLARDKFDTDDTPPPARPTFSYRENERRDDSESRAIPRYQPERVHTTQESNAVIVISNLAPSVLKEDLDELLGFYSPKLIDMHRDSAGNFVGSATVEVTQQQAKDIHTNYNFSELDGKELVINFTTVSGRSTISESEINHRDRDYLCQFGNRRSSPRSKHTVTRGSDYDWNNRSERYDRDTSIGRYGYSNRVESSSNEKPVEYRRRTFEEIEKDNFAKGRTFPGKKRPDLSNDRTFPAKKRNRTF